MNTTLLTSKDINHLSKVNDNIWTFSLHLPDLISKNEMYEREYLQYSNTHKPAA